MKLDFPRHLYLPFLIYDAVNEGTKKKNTPPPPPAESRTVQVKIKPLIDYVERIIQSSKSDIQQDITQVASFTLTTAGKGQLTVKGNVNVKQKLDARAYSTSIINTTIVNRLQTELPDLFANVVVSGPTTAQDPDLWISLKTKIRDNITQFNYSEIVQSSVDVNKATIIVRGRFEVDSIDIDQDILTKVVAVNLIQNIIDNVVEISASDGTDDDTQVSEISILGVVAAVLSSLCSCILCILILVLLLKNKK
jgi:hypothetical protein